MAAEWSLLYVHVNSKGIVPNAYRALLIEANGKEQIRHYDRIVCYTNRVYKGINALIHRKKWKR